VGRANDRGAHHVRVALAKSKMGGGSPMIAAPAAPPPRCRWLRSGV